MLEHCPWLYPKVIWFHCLVKLLTTCLSGNKRHFEFIVLSYKQGSTSLNQDRVTFLFRKTIMNVHGRLPVWKKGKHCIYGSRKYYNLGQNENDNS